MRPVTFAAETVSAAGCAAAAGRAAGWGARAGRPGGAGWVGTVPGAASIGAAGGVTSFAPTPVFVPAVSASRAVRESLGAVEGPEPTGSGAGSGAPGAES